MKYLSILLIFTQLVTHFVPLLSAFREHDHSIRNSYIFEDPTLQNDFGDQNVDCNCTNECNCLICNNTLLRPKKIINQYKEELSNRVPPKPFGSFCMKCAACLAVANEIQNIIEGASQECETDLTKRRDHIVEIEEKINSLCEAGFKNFDLRLYGHHGIITNNFECTTHIVTMMDGCWTKKLREICSLYISRIDVETIASNVIDSTGNLTDTFCRGTGVFRDCANIKNHENITMPPCKNYNS